MARPTILAPAANYYPPFSYDSGGVAGDLGVAGGWDLSTDPPAAEWAGAAMTRVASTGEYGLFLITSPGTGSRTIDNATGDLYVVGAMKLAGVNLGSVVADFGSLDEGAGAEDTLALSIPCSADQLIVAYLNSGVQTWTPGGNTVVEAVTEDGQKGGLLSSTGDLDLVMGATTGFRVAWALINGVSSAGSPDARRLPRGVARGLERGMQMVRATSGLFVPSHHTPAGLVLAGA